MTTTEHDRAALARAAELARHGVGMVEPNPPVGAVLYRGAEILSEGWHECYGEPHAEARALQGIESVPEDACLAVTLEPCSSQGKQPACTDLLRATGVRRLVVGERDPDPRHEGRGLELLARQGVEVHELPGVVPPELLRDFRAHLERDRPYVWLKWATTLDGAWALGEGQGRWITGAESRARVHALRAHMDGILVGSGTLLADDPSLTARPPGPRPLRRIVLDRRGRTPVTARLFQEGDPRDVWVISAAQDRWPQGTTLPWPPSWDLAQVLAELRRRGIQRLLVEGGPTLIAALLQQDLVDRAWVFVAPVLARANERTRLPRLRTQAARQPRTLTTETVGCDALFQLSWS